MAYYRVSTDKQGQSGLGLDAQRAAVELHARSVGAEVIAEFQDVESGRKADRIGLAEALATCRAKRATLLIVKLDRLARSVAFISNLMEGGVDFVAADMPSVNRLHCNASQPCSSSRPAFRAARPSAAPPHDGNTPSRCSISCARFSTPRWPGSAARAPWQGRSATP